MPKKIPAEAAPEPTDSADEHRYALDYARRVYAETVEWYRIADSKSQLILTLAGVFISILAGAVFSSPREVGERTAIFGLESWLFLATAGLSVSAAIACAVVCLRSRLRNARASSAACFRVHNDPPTYAANATWWFGTIARLDPSAYERQIGSIRDDGFQLESVTSQIPILADHVLMKHRWVNRGWSCLGLALVAVLATAASYVVRA
jgi:hypothetical protein